MAKVRYLHAPLGRDDLYSRRRVPEELHALFNCGDFYKVPLGTKDPRTAEPLLAIADGEFEKKAAAFREALKSQAGGALSPDEAKALVERYLTGRSGDGFASGEMQVPFIPLELDKAVDDLAGRCMLTSQDMPAGDWTAYRKRLAGSADDDEFGGETPGRVEADRSIRHRPPGQAWFQFHARLPRRHWRPLLPEPVAALKRKLALAEGMIAGIDELLAGALAMALLSPEVRSQLPQAPSARRRNRADCARPEMKLSAPVAR